MYGPQASVFSMSNESPSSATQADELAQLGEAFKSRHRWLVITGAGISTASGISDYRDQHGEWKRPQPVQHQAFMQRHESRQRYWGRSQLGFPEFMRAQPNAAHEALVQMEAAGRVTAIITQNVDRLHQRAGSAQVLDLHGRLDQVRCMQCHTLRSRASVQTWLEQHNPRHTTVGFNPAPDGDADVELDFSQMQVPSCEECGGILKPDVVFFGDSVPRDEVQLAMDWLDQADGVLVVGSSLMVFSSYRFVRRANQLDKPILAINRGVTRGDALFTYKAQVDCSTGLDALTHLL